MKIATVVSNRYL